MNRLLARVLIFAGISGAVTVTQNIVFYRREEMMRQIPKGASEARVIELLGPPATRGADSWYYKPTFIGLLRCDLRTDDMMVLFEGRKVEDGFMTPD